MTLPGVRRGVYIRKRHLVDNRETSIRGWYRLVRKLDRSAWTDPKWSRAGSHGDVSMPLRSDIICVQSWQRPAVRGEDKEEQ
jgi:hypothetical protein